MGVEDGEANPELVADAVSDILVDEEEQVGGLPEEPQRVTNDVETSVESMIERRLHETTYTNIANYLKKILRDDGVNGSELTARLEKEGANGWKTLVGTVQPPTASEKNDMREVLRTILDITNAPDAKDPEGGLKKRAKEVLQALLDYIGMGITVEDIEAMEPQMSPSSSNSQLYNAVAGEEAGTRRKK